MSITTVTLEKAGTAALISSAIQWGVLGKRGSGIIGESPNFVFTNALFHGMAVLEGDFLNGLVMPDIDESMSSATAMDYAQSGITYAIGGAVNSLIAPGDLSTVQHSLVSSVSGMGAKWISEKYY